MRYLIIFFIAMLPLAELRIAIPTGLTMNVPIIQTYIISLIGNILPLPFVFYFSQKILSWGKDKKYIGSFFTFCLEKGKQAGKKLQKKAGRGMFLALVLFVGIPVPGTGAWTGTLAASFLDMGFKKSVIAVMLGVLIAGVIMALASMGLFGGISFLFAPKS